MASNKNKPESLECAELLTILDQLSDKDVAEQCFPDYKKPDEHFLGYYSSGNLCLAVKPKIRRYVDECKHENRAVKLCEVHRIFRQHHREYVKAEDENRLRSDLYDFLDFTYGGMFADRVAFQSQVDKIAEYLLQKRNAVAKLIVEPTSNSNETERRSVEHKSAAGCWVGTGFGIDLEGNPCLVTNSHVVIGPNEVKVMKIEKKASDFVPGSPPLLAYSKPTYGTADYERGDFSLLSLDESNIKTESRNALFSIDEQVKTTAILLRHSRSQLLSLLKIQKVNETHAWVTLMQLFRLKNSNVECFWMTQNWTTQKFQDLSAHCLNFFCNERFARKWDVGLPDASSKPEDTRVAKKLFATLWLLSGSLRQLHLTNNCSEQNKCNSRDLEFVFLVLSAAVTKLRSQRCPFGTIFSIGAYKQQPVQVDNTLQHLLDTAGRLFNSLRSLNQREVPDLRSPLKTALEDLSKHIKWRSEPILFSRCFLPFLKNMGIDLGSLISDILIEITLIHTQQSFEDFQMTFSTAHDDGSQFVALAQAMQIVASAFRCMIESDLSMHTKIIDEHIKLFDYVITEALITIGHPHGGKMRISFGNTHYTGSDRNRPQWVYDGLTTCPGSSGGPVLAVRCGLNRQLHIFLRGVHFYDGQGLRIHQIREKILSGEAHCEQLSRESSTNAQLTALSLPSLEAVERIQLSVRRLSESENFDQKMTVMSQIYWQLDISADSKRAFLWLGGTDLVLDMIDTAANHPPHPTKKLTLDILLQMLMRLLCSDKEEAFIVLSKPLEMLIIVSSVLTEPNFQNRFAAVAILKHVLAFARGWFENRDLMQAHEQFDQSVIKAIDNWTDQESRHFIEVEGGPNVARAVRELLLPELRKTDSLSHFSIWILDRVLRGAAKDNYLSVLRSMNIVDELRAIVDTFVTRTEGLNLKDALCRVVAAIDGR